LRDEWKGAEFAGGGSSNYIYEERKVEQVRKSQGWQLLKLFIGAQSWVIFPCSRSHHLWKRIEEL
jgi:hypothetical protein